MDRVSEDSVSEDRVPESRVPETESQKVESQKSGVSVGRLRSWQSFKERSLIRQSLRRVERKSQKLEL